MSHEFDSDELKRFTQSSSAVEILEFALANPFKGRAIAKMFEVYEVELPKLDPLTPGIPEAALHKAAVALAIELARTYGVEGDDVADAMLMKYDWLDGNLPDIELDDAWLLAKKAVKRYLFMYGEDDLRWKIAGAVSWSTAFNGLEAFIEVSDRHQVWSKGDEHAYVKLLQHTLLHIAEEAESSAR